MNEDIMFIILSFVVSFFLTFAAIPSIIKVSRIKNLYDKPDERRVHKFSTPTLGGVAIFAGLSISVLFFCDFVTYQSIKYLMISIIIMFFVGIKDDILIIAPWTKLILQIVAAFILVVFGGVEITDFHGFFGINEITRLIGIPLSVILIIVIVNAINFIDGIDGYSATVGIIISTTFGIWFYLVGEYSYTVISAALAGGLIAFLKYNIFGEENKIFMGDTGTLIMGLILSFLAIEFNEKNLEIPTSNYYILPAPAITFGILIVPLFDFLRIVFIRLIIRKPIFLPDKRHLHHLFLDLGFSHIKTVIIIASANIFFIILTFWLSEFVTIRRLLLVIMILALVLSSLPKIIINAKNKNKNKTNP